MVPRGILGRAGYCRLHDQSLLPWMGAMEFDEADLARVEEEGDLEELILHEMGHTLGVGTAWGRHELLENPTLLFGGWLHSPGRDAHFVGPLAAAAFDEAGGDAYTDGEKVPVENCLGRGSGDGHWRQSYWSEDLPESNCRGGEVLLGGELMSPLNTLGVPEPLSKITIQSLADLGYTVDVGEAAPYTLPEPGEARRYDPARMLEYGDDILRGPITVHDRIGRIVRLIRN